jgi:histidine triad (HIT) family protein
MGSIFTKIIQRQLPAEVLFENEHVIVIKDIHPVAPIHLLIISKKEVSSIQFLKEEDMYLMEEIIKAAQEVSKRLELTDYRLLTNNGALAGQSVFHLHFHLIGGRELTTLG